MGIFNPNPNLFKPALTSAHIDHPTSLMAVRFSGFAGARVLGIRPIVEGVQSVANRLEQFGLRAGHAFFVCDFHRHRVLFPLPKDFNLLFAR